MNNISAFLILTEFSFMEVSLGICNKIVSYLINASYASKVAVFESHTTFLLLTEFSFMKVSLGICNKIVSYSIKVSYASKVAVLESRIIL